VLRHRYRDGVREFRRAQGRIQWNVEERLREVLPAGTRFASTAHVVVGGDAWGIAFSDRDDIAIRIDDFIPGAPSQKANLTDLGSLLCHELFHVGFRAAGGLPPRPEPYDEDWIRLANEWGAGTVGEIWRASELPGWNAAAIEGRLSAWVLPPAWDVRALDRTLALLSRLQNEGLAVYAELPLRGPEGVSIRKEWMSKIDEDFALLQQVMDRLDHGASAHEIDDLAADGFLNDGPFYRIGLLMTERIDEFTGRKVLHETIERGALDFFESYFETHPYGPGQIDARTEETIRKLTEEIRAVGSFDPDAG